MKTIAYCHMCEIEAGRATFTGTANLPMHTCGFYDVNASTFGAMLSAKCTCNQCGRSMEQDLASHLYWCPFPDCPNFALLQIPAEQIPAERSKL